MVGDKLSQHHNEIFSIKRRFLQLLFRHFGVNESLVGGNKYRYTPSKYSTYHI